MKFIYAYHLVDMNGTEITVGVTPAGEVRMMAPADNAYVARLTPRMTADLCVALTRCAALASTHADPQRKGSPTGWAADRYTRVAGRGGQLAGPA